MRGSCKLSSVRTVTVFTGEAAYPLLVSAPQLFRTNCTIDSCYLLLYLLCLCIELYELHGNSNLEKCCKCKREYLRDFRTRTSMGVHSHETGQYYNYYNYYNYIAMYIFHTWCIDLYCRSQVWWPWLSWWSQGHNYQLWREPSRRYDPAAINGVDN